MSIYRVIFNFRKTCRKDMFATIDIVFFEQLCEVLDFEDYLSCLSNSWYR